MTPDQLEALFTLYVYSVIIIWVVGFIAAEHDLIDLTVLAVLWPLFVIARALRLLWEVLTGQ